MKSQGARSANIVITRSREGNQELARKLKLAGLNPIPVDTFSLAPPRDWRRVDRLLKQLAVFDWIMFTSAAGVRYFGVRMKALALRLPWEGKPKVAAVGQRTADALSEFGVRPDFVPSSYMTRALAEEFSADRGARILLLRTDLAGRHLAKRLVERGFYVAAAAIYRTTLPSGGPNLKIADADAIVFASPSAVRGFCSLVSRDELRPLKKLRAVCIGPVTESAARARGFTNTTTPGRYTLEEVVHEVRRLSRRDV